MYLNNIVLCILFQSNVKASSIFHAVFTVNTMSTTTVIYLYTTVVILRTLGVVEKADSEYKTLFYAKFIKSE